MKPRIIVLVCTFLVFSLAPAPIAMSAGEGSVSSEDTLYYEHEYDLEGHVKTETIIGTRGPAGDCRFSFPTLELGPDETAIEARPVSTDLRACTQVIEIGTPPAASLVDEPNEDATSITRPFTTRSTPSTKTSGWNTTASNDNSLALLATATVYFEVRWEDIIHADVNRTRAYLQWTWNGTCVTSSSAWGDWWWLALTGWSFVSGDGYKTASCNNHRSIVDWAHYMNNFWCAPTDVDTYVNDAWARGYFNGTVGGNVLGTWSPEDPSDPQCLPLHYHTVLVKQP